MKVPATLGPPTIHDWCERARRVASGDRSETERTLQNKYFVPTQSGLYCENDVVQCGDSLWAGYVTVPKVRYREGTLIALIISVRKN